MKTISFKAAMIRAEREGRKTMTRRLVKPQPVGKQRVWEGLAHVTIGMNPADDGAVWYVADGINPGIEIRCPYGVVGDKLAVKEAAWMWCARRANGITKSGRQKWLYVPVRSAPIHYHADHPQRPATFTEETGDAPVGSVFCWRLKVARFLPAWAVRTYLEITSVRVERLQDITRNDAICEGVGGTYGETGYDLGWPGANHEWDNKTSVEQFAWLWSSINGPGSWELNPYVWVIGFRRVSK